MYVYTHIRVGSKAFVRRTWSGGSRLVVVGSRVRQQLLGAVRPVAPAAFVI